MSDTNQVARNSAFRTFRKNLMGGTALVAVVAVGVSFGVGQYSPAMAGNTANLAGTGSATTPPVAGETIAVADNTTNAIWDATDGLGTITSDLTFTGGGIGAASIKLEDSTGAGTIIIRNISVTDDANTSTINVDGTNGADRGMLSWEVFCRVFMTRPPCVTIPRPSDSVAHVSRYTASPRRTLLAENLGLPSL